MSATRVEHDSMGPVELPAEARYGAATQRAVLNFPISGYRFGRPFIRALGLVKYAGATANEALGRLAPELAEPIRQAAREVLDGRHDADFVVDVFQTGSGTSTNMNANEVIANRATDLAAGRRGTQRIHPNDHVNMGQSSNDAIPAAMHIAAVEAIHDELLPALDALHAALLAKAQEFDAILKIARTHLQDATPIRLGQEFSGYAAQIAQCQGRLARSAAELLELPLGGTAVGTGLNTHPKFARRVCDVLNAETGQAFYEASNHFAAQHAQDAVVATAAALKVLAISLTKITNDIRWLGSGPRCGLGELRLPAVQPGSSIMPGKVNPVICEAVLQVCAHVVGAEAAITHAAGLLGNLDLHAGMPVMAHHLLEALRLTANACRVFTDKCVVGLQADEQRCAALLEQSLAVCTSLAPRIGYDRAAALAKRAYETGRTVRQVALEEQVLDAATLDALLDPGNMTAPH